MRVIIVDDEIYAIETLKQMLLNYSDIDIVDTYTDPLLAISNLNHTKPDIIFLDINLGSYSGIDLANEFFNYDSNIEIVFVTAYSEYALLAFELNAQDYLLKPITQKRLDKTIERIRNISNLNNSFKEKYFIKAFGDFELLVNQNDSVKWRTKKTKELFAYLWFYRNMEIDRNRLINDIFPDKNLSSSQALLHTSIYQVRKSLSNYNIKSDLIFNNEKYKLNIEISSDYDELLDIINKDILDENDIERVFELYKNELFANQDYTWADFERIQLNTKVVNKLKVHSDNCLKAEDVSLNLEVLLKYLIKLEPLDEDVVIKLMNYYAKRNEYLQLDYFYEEYSKMLKDEYGFDVSEYTQKTYMALVK